MFEKSLCFLRGIYGWSSLCHARFYVKGCLNEEVNALIQALCFSFGIGSAVHPLCMNSKGPKDLCTLLLCRCSNARLIPNTGRI